jgi:spore coat polysaccharide biosynthesis predicted glycosyltransferase SpsG
VFIEILTAGSHEHGFGHVKRSSVLASYLSSAGHNVSQRDITDSISNTEEFLDMPYVNCRILDLPPKLEAHLGERMGSQSILVSLDGVKIQSDLNFTIYQHSNSNSIQNYVGYEYAIISDEFLKYRNFPFFATNEYKSVCVCLGGGDVLGQGPIISEQLSSRGFSVTLICGPYVSYKLDSDKLPFKVIREPRNIADTFQKSDWIVSNAGGTLFEALSMGKQVVSCPQTAEEEVVGQDLLKKGALLGLGIESAINPEFSLGNEVIELAMKTIDGLGKSRIKSMIEEVLNFA